MKKAQPVYQWDDYRAFLIHNLDHGEEKTKGQRSALASAMNCQLSYLSRVLKGEAELSLEQGEAAGRYFALAPQEKSFLLTLISEARAGTPELKDYWRAEKKRLASERLQLSKRITLEQPLTEEQMLTYYSEWYFSAIHVLAGVPNFQTADALAQTLRLSPMVVRKTLHFLVSVNLLERAEDKYRQTKKQIHLDRDSHLLRHHHINWKLKSVASYAFRKPGDLHYSSVVSLSRADLLQLKEEFLRCIEAVRSRIRDSKDETAAVYMLDLFEIADSV